MSRILLADGQEIEVDALDDYDQARRLLDQLDREIITIEQQVWHCHDLIVLAQNHEAGSEVCYYDAVSRTLVGVTVVGDAGAYCDGTSATIEAGRVDNSCSANAPEFSRDCAANGGS